MNVKEQMFEKDVTDVEVNAESSWMLQKREVVSEKCKHNEEAGQQD